MSRCNIIIDHHFKFSVFLSITRAKCRFMFTQKKKKLSFVLMASYSCYIPQPFSITCNSYGLFSKHY